MSRTLECSQIYQKFQFYLLEYGVGIWCRILQPDTFYEYKQYFKFLKEITVKKNQFFLSSIIKLGLFFGTSFPLFAFSALDIGVGSSSFTYGRPIPSVNLSFVGSSWALEYQSEGVQTTIYSQNAWTVGATKTFQDERFSFGGASFGAGLGGSYFHRSYRENPTAKIEETSEYAVGPYISIKYRIGFLFFGFNTLLGLTSKIQDHIVLNYQDVSHVTIGFSI